MNVILESFMIQYLNGRFILEHEDIYKFKRDEYETETLNTIFNKDIYLDFKNLCKKQGYFVKHVLMAFMEEFNKGEYNLELVKKGDIKKEKRRG